MVYVSIKYSHLDRLGRVLIFLSIFACIFFIGVTFLADFFGGLVVGSIAWFLAIVSMLVFLLSGLFGSLFYIPMWRIKKRAFGGLKNIVDRLDLLRTDQVVSEITLPPHILIDSMDREILLAITDLGSMEGNIIGIEDILYDKGLSVDEHELYERLARIHLLGLIAISYEKKSVYLLSNGIDAINTPPILFASSIPKMVLDRVITAKSALRQEKWTEVIIECFKALEITFKHLVKQALVRDSSVEEEIEKIGQKRPLERFTGGMLRDLITKIRVIKKDSHESYLSKVIIDYRTKAHDKEGGGTFTSYEAETCDICLSLLLRSLYRPS